MYITIFGGSFNPPTLGHALVLEQIFKLKLIPKLDEVWLLPEYQHSFAKNHELVEVKHRLSMSQFLLRDRVKLQTACIDQKLSGNTIDHANYLKKIYPQHRFSFLLGSDNLKSFDLWPQWQKLLKLMTFYIYPRQGYAFKPLYPGMVALKNPQQKISNIASTMVREKIKKDLPWEHLVQEPVAGYIKQQQLF